MKSPHISELGWAAGTGEPRSNRGAEQVRKNSVDFIYSNVSGIMMHLKNEAVTSVGLCSRSSLQTSRWWQETSWFSSWRRRKQTPTHSSWFGTAGFLLLDVLKRRSDQLQHLKIFNMEILDYLYSHPDADLDGLSLFEAQV